VVLMDVQMPRRGGFEGTGIIRERERQLGRHTPIVAVTAHAMKGDRERCLEAGMDDYTTKLLKTAELLAIIQRLTSEESGEVTPTSPSEGQNSASELLARFDGKEELLRGVARTFGINTRCSWTRSCPPCPPVTPALCSGRLTASRDRPENFDDQAAATARRLEEIARPGDLTEASRACAELEAVMARLESWLSPLGGWRRDRHPDRSLSLIGHDGGKVDMWCGQPSQSVRDRKLGVARQDCPLGSA
jgi:two-component system sensor histidine kinase/response regulator